MRSYVVFASVVTYGLTSHASPAAGTNIGSLDTLLNGATGSSRRRSNRIMEASPGDVE